MLLAVVLALAVWLAALTEPAAGPAVPAAATATSPGTAVARPQATATAAAVPPGRTATQPEQAAIPDLAPHAGSAVLMDAASGRVIWSKNPNQPRPAASITKLMTVDLRQRLPRAA